MTGPRAGPKSWRAGPVNFGGSPGRAEMKKWRVGLGHQNHGPCAGLTTTTTPKTVAIRTEINQLQKIQNKGNSPISTWKMSGPPSPLHSVEKSGSGQERSQDFDLFRKLLFSSIFQNFFRRHPISLLCRIFWGTFLADLFFFPRKHFPMNFQQNSSKKSKFAFFSNLAG